MPRRMRKNIVQPISRRPSTPLWGTPRTPSFTGEPGARSRLLDQYGPCESHVLCLIMRDVTTPMVHKSIPREQSGSHSLRGADAIASREGALVTCASPVLELNGTRAICRDESSQNA